VILAPRQSEIRHYHGFCGIGGFARGMNQGRARVGHIEATFRCIGGFDVDAVAVRDFRRIVGVPATHLDLFSYEDYVAFHGKEPPPGWREVTTEDIRRSAGYEWPHILCTSPPCKGFSGLLPQERSNGAKYQALNRLALRGLTLMLEAWADDPPEFVLLENVPRIATRGRHLLDAIQAILRSFGYAYAETTHDCGELGNLGQSRKRFLMVARHAAKVPPFLYEPDRRPLRSVGEIIGDFPLPGDAAAGPMHRMRVLQWLTWVRLAFVDAGSDWRSLEKLRVEDGYLKDFGIVPEAGYHRGVLGVNAWTEPAGTVTAGGRPGQGRFAVADPRIENTGEYGQLGVKRWDEPSNTVSGKSQPGGGRYAVADPRPGSWDWSEGRRGLAVVPWQDNAGAVTGQARAGQGGFSVADPRLPPDDARHWNKFRVVDWERPAGTVVANAHRPGGGEQSVADPRLGNGPRGPHFNNVYRVVRFDQVAPTVTAGTSPSAGGLAVADPRAQSEWKGKGKYRVAPWDDAAGTIIAASTTGNGGFAVADPRQDFARRREAEGSPWQTPGHYGVVPWDQPSGVVVGAAAHDNGKWNVADPRHADVNMSFTSLHPGEHGLPPPDTRLVAVIRALDGTWHRPFTTLELAALQGLVFPGEHLELEGMSDSVWREHIGNCVPPPAAAAIASEMGRTLLLAWSGETFVLSRTPIWVRPIAIALAVHQPEVM
jgi:site-specific DNA-cytosine methylase